MHIKYLQRNLCHIFGLVTHHHTYKLSESNETHTKALTQNNQDDLDRTPTQRTQAHDNSTATPSVSSPALPHGTENQVYWKYSPCPIRWGMLTDECSCRCDCELPRWRLRTEAHQGLQRPAVVARIHDLRKRTHQGLEHRRRANNSIIKFIR